MQGWEDVPDGYEDLEDGEVNEAIRALEEADHQANAEEERDSAIETRARVDRSRFQTELEADRYAKYVATGWRKPDDEFRGSQALPNFW